MATTTTQSYYDIPNDVIDRIILCLPAKSLLRFKCVCKYWFSLISDNNFVKTHTNHHSSATTTFQTHQIVDEQLVLLSEAPLVRSRIVRRRILRYCSSNSTGGTGDHASSSELVKVGCPFDSNYSDYKILGSCNGLVCFSLITSTSTSHRYGNRPYHVEFSAWNPCTGEFKKIGKHPRINYVDYSHSNYGFGYDHSVDDYKLVCNAYKHDGYNPFIRIDDRSCELYSIQVYTLGTNSWKNIDPHPYKYFYSTISMSSEQDQGVFANGGGLYWIVKDSQSKREMIICFDIITERYREVSKPSDVYKIINVGLLQGCLCMIGREKDTRFCVDIWMMMPSTMSSDDIEGGNAKEEEYSWIRYFSIRTPIIAFTSLLHLKPLKWFYHEENGDHVLMMMVNKEFLVWYDPKRDIAAYPLWCSDMRSIDTETTYIESLVSLKSGIYMRRRPEWVVEEVAAVAAIERKRRRTEEKKMMKKKI